MGQRLDYTAQGPPKERPRPRTTWVDNLHLSVPTILCFSIAILFLLYILLGQDKFAGLLLYPVFLCFIIGIPFGATWLRRK